MKKNLILLIVLMVSVTSFGQDIYGTIDNPDSTLIFKSNFDCNTTLVYNLKRKNEYNIFSFAQGNNNNLIGSTENKIVEIDTLRSNSKILFDFSGTGEHLFPTILRNGNFIYGLTDSGGANNTGYYFRIDINSLQLEILFSLPTNIYCTGNLAIFNNNLYSSFSTSIPANPYFQISQIRIDLSNLQTEAVLVPYNDSYNQSVFYPWNYSVNFQKPWLINHQICHANLKTAINELFTSASTINSFQGIDYISGVKNSSAVQLSDSIYIFIRRTNIYERVIKHTIDDINGYVNEEILYSQPASSYSNFFPNYNNVSLIGNNLFWNVSNNGYGNRFHTFNLNSLQYNQTIVIDHNQNDIYNSVHNDAAIHLFGNTIIFGHSTGLRFYDINEVLFQSQPTYRRMMYSSKNLAAFYPKGNNEFIIASSDGLTIENTQSNSCTRLIDRPFGSTKIIQSANGQYLLLSVNGNARIDANGNLIYYTGYSAPSGGPGLDITIEPIVNRVFYKYGTSSSSLREYNLINDQTYGRISYPGGIYILSFVDTKDGNLLYVVEPNSSDPNVPEYYINLYNIVSNTSTTIDSAMLNTPKFEAFRSASLNYIGNGKISLTTQNAGTFGIGQVSIYDIGTKQVTSHYSFDTPNQVTFKPLNHGQKLIGAVPIQSNYNYSDRLTSYDLSLPSIGINECFQTDDANSEYLSFNLICPNCTYNGELGLFSLEKQEDTLKLVVFPSPATASTTVRFFADKSDVSVQVFSLNGSLVFADDKTRNVGSMNDVDINLTDFNKGFYIVKVGKDTQKLIIE